MVRLLFITPVFERFELTRLCMMQHRWVCDELGKYGIDATNVIVGNDANLHTAHEFDFPIVEHSNDYLGAKFNAGWRYAHEHGYDYGSPVGSDTWIDPKVYSYLNTEPNPFVATRFYSIVHRRGLMRADMKVRWGVHQVIGVPQLQVLRFQPCQANLRRGCDTSTRQNIVQYVQPKVYITHREVHQYESVAFQSEQQISGFQNLTQRHRGVITKHETVEDTLAPLRKHYPNKLVEKMIHFYSKTKEAAA